MTLRQGQQKKQHTARSIHRHPIPFAQTVYSPSEAATRVPTYYGVVVSVKTIGTLRYYETIIIRMLLQGEAKRVIDRRKEA